MGLDAVDGGEKAFSRMDDLCATMISLVADGNFNFYLTHFSNE